VSDLISNLKLKTLPVFRRPVRVSKEGIQIDTKGIERDVFYIVAYEGDKFAIRVTKDGMLETYEIEEG
jgi:hypothetical protein